MSNKNHKCPFCNLKFVDKDTLYNHIGKKHKALIPNDISIPQYVFNVKYNKEFGKCVICGNKTKWNPVVERYDRLCSERCKEEYKKAFQKRMLNKHGKVYLTQDPEHQRKMLANRKISGKYTWSNGVTEVGYTGSYELEFLKFLDIVMNFNGTDIISPAPQNFYYKDENGKDRFYFPDFFIPSLNLIVEIKDGGNNPNKHHKIQDVDKKIEKIKDNIMLTQKEFNYVKISNKDHAEFLQYLIELKDHDPVKCKTPLIRLNESTFNNLENKLLKNNYYSNQSKFLESVRVYSESEKKMYTDLLKMSIYTEESFNILEEQFINNVVSNLDLSLIEEAEKDKYGNYKKKDLNNYALKEEKLYPMNNLRDFKKNVRMFKNCPLLKRKKLATSLVVYCEEYQEKIPASSPIWNFVDKKPHLIKEDSNHDTLKYSNDNYYLADLKFSNVESYPDINKILDSVEDFYLSSDYHLWQTKRKNLFTAKPIENINELIIRNQQLTVKSTDVFIFLGDLVNDEFTNKEELVHILNKLSGYKILVQGNNDIFDESFYETCGFNKVVKGFKWNNYVFTHYPISVPEPYINIHGHIHGSRSYMEADTDNHIDVYVDLYDYQPVSFKQALNLHKQGFYRGQSNSPEYYFDKTFEKDRLTDETNSKIFDYLGKIIDVKITNRRMTTDKNHSYYATNYGITINENIPIYILGYNNIKNNYIKTVVIGCIERMDNTKVLIGKYEYNEHIYSPLELKTLTYIQEKEHTLYYYNEKSKLTKKVDIELNFDDVYSDDFTSSIANIEGSLFAEGFNIDAEGTIIINMKEKNNFMNRYMSSHKLLKIYEQTASYENIKYELCKLYYMVLIIDSYYMTKDKNFFMKLIKSPYRADAIKAKAFIMNDFTRYLKLVLEHEKDFNFYKYFERTDYYKDVIKITPDNIKGIKKIIQSIVV